MRPQISYVAVGTDALLIAEALYDAFGPLWLTVECSSSPDSPWVELKTAQDIIPMVLNGGGYATQTQYRSNAQRSEQRRGFVLSRLIGPWIEIIPAGVCDGHAREGRLFLYDNEDGAFLEPFQNAARTIRRKSTRVWPEEVTRGFPEALNSMTSVRTMCGSIRPLDRSRA